MSAQQKALLRWTLIGLAASILISTLSVVSSGGLGIREIDRFDIWNAGVIGFWIGRLGFIPLICILVVVARTFKKAGPIRSMGNMIAAILLTMFAIGVGAVALAAVQPVNQFPFASGRGRDDFVSTVLKACVTKQQAVPGNQSVSEAAISGVCTCYANSLASSTTAEDVQRSKAGSPSAVDVTRMNAAWQKCLRP